MNRINVKGQVVTIDAMGTQTAIAEKIRARRADYVLALKGNQSSLLNDVREYFEDKELCSKTKDAGGYKRTAE